MTDLELWSLVVGVILPPFIAVLQQPTWHRSTRALVTLGVCVTVGTVTAYVNQAWTQGGITHGVLTTLIAAWTSYQHLWKPTGATGAIEVATALRVPASDDQGPTGSVR